MRGRVEMRGAELLYEGASRTWLGAAHTYT